MSQWISGDTLDSATLNAKLASASSVGGYSTNTLQSESAATIKVLVSQLNVGGGTPGTAGVISVTSAPGVARDLISLTATMSGQGGPLGLYCLPTIDGPDDGVNNMGAAGFGATALLTNGSVCSQWNTVVVTQPQAMTGGGSLVSNLGVLVSDFTLGTRNYALYTGRGQNRFGDTSRFTDGSAVAPSLAMDSEVSLGFHRSGTSTVALSYGTFVVPSLSVNSGGIGFRVDASGLTLCNSTPVNAYLFAASAQSGRGLGVLYVGNCQTVPSVAPTGGGILFARSGALLWMGGSGSLTTIAVA